MPRAAPHENPDAIEPLCPGCEYPLTGLPAPRCPECGQQTTWEAARDFADHRPRLAFERARGAYRAVAFLQTWATILFLPWRFAADITRSVNTRAALAFVAVCFLGTLLAFFFDADWKIIVTWLLTASIYIVLQTLWLSLFDWHGAREWTATVRFWLLTGCYTSAIMMTEFVYGPPLLMLSDLWEVIRWKKPSSFGPDFFEFSVGACVWWVQMAFWLIGLAWVFARRRARHHAPWHVLVLTYIVTLTLIVLYAAVVQHVGQQVYAWVEDPF